MKNFFLAVFFNTVLHYSYSQGIGIGTNSPDNSAMLEVQSTSKGLLLPRMTTLQRNSIVSPATGLSVFNLDDLCTDIFDGINWIKNCGLKQTGTETLTGNSWYRIRDLGVSVTQSRTGAIGFSIGNKGYIGLGSSTVGDFWEYDPSNFSWSQKASFPGGARSYAVGFAISNKGYVGTGFAGVINKKDFWEYNPLTNVWVQKTDFGGTARQGATGFSINNKGYIGTGYDGVNKKDFWEYDPVTDIWMQKADFGGTARLLATGFSIGNKGYIGTGVDASFKKDFWEFDPVTNAWIQKADFGGTARQGAVGLTIDGKGYMGTGYDGATKKDFWEYNPLTNGWVQKTDFAGSARDGAVGFAIGAAGYIGSGFSSSATKDFWQYIPQTISYPVYTAPSSFMNTGIIADAIWTKTATGKIRSNEGTVNIDSLGNVGIGGFPAAGSSKLYVFGNITATGTITPSDVRYKKNIQTIINPLERIKQLNGVTYLMNRQAYPVWNFDSGLQYGLIAQEVEKVFPEMVRTIDEKNMKGVDYIKLIPVLIEAIKAQQIQIEKLNEELQILKRVR